MDSDEADEENKAEDGGKTLLYVFERGWEQSAPKLEPNVPSPL